MTRAGLSEEEREVNRVARLLMAEWERVEKPVTPSYVASFADMARAVVADHAARTADLAAQVARVRSLFAEGGDFEACRPDDSCPHTECETAYAVLAALSPAQPDTERAGGTETP